MNERQYFAVYNLLKENPEKTVAENDLNMLELMYGGKRLWYRVGAYMASRIDEEFGRKKLVDLLKDKPSAFINLYLKTK